MASLKEFLGSTGLGALWARITEELNKKATSADLADVATSGSYNDLEDKPFIPSAVSDLTDDSGHYTKPANGIPASDLEETYLTSFTETDPTVPSWAKEAEKPTYTAAEVGAMATDHPANDITAVNIETWTKKTNLLDVSSDHNNVYDYWWTLTIPRNALWNINNGPGTSGKLKYLYVPSTEGNNLIRLELPTSNGKLALITDVPAWARATDKPTYTAQEVGALPADTVIPTVPTNVSAFTNDAGYITGYTETDPTVPAWAKTSTKPSYTAAEVGAPTVAEMNSAIGSAIGNVHQFEVEIVQELPVENIKEHTVYFVPKSGVTDDVYDEYVYIDNAWEMIGNTQIDLSNYVQKNQYATQANAGVIKVISTGSTGVTMMGVNSDFLGIYPAPITEIQSGSGSFRPITADRQHSATFYGLAKAAGDTTQAQSDNAVGTYTDAAKTAIRTMLGVATPADIPTNVSAFTNDAGYLTQHQSLDNYVQKTDYASTSNAGIVKVKPENGISIYDNFLWLPSPTNTEIKEGSNSTKSLKAVHQDVIAFYGLAKAAGDATQSSSNNAIGTYTTEAKAAIRSMIGAAASADLTVQDVQINGASILSNGIANIPLADDTHIGAVKIHSDYGWGTTKDGYLRANGASTYQMRQGTDFYRPIVSANQHISVFFALAKIAGHDEKDSPETIGTYTGAAKQAIQNMFGITNLLSTEESSTATAAHALNSTFMMNGKLYRATTAIVIGDAVVEGQNCEVVKADEVFIKKTDYASSEVAGLIKTSPTYGLSVNSSTGLMSIIPATVGHIKAGTAPFEPITVNFQHYSVFYGLSKAAGVDLKDETVTFGTYPETSKTAIRSLIGAAAASDIPSVPVQDIQINGASIVSNGVANFAIASSSTLGVVKVSDTGAFGLSKVQDIDANNQLYYTGEIAIYPASNGQIKGSSGQYNPITPVTQHRAVFFGLAKAAGDSTQSASSNAVGTYTDGAKSAIQTMLGITDALASKLDAAEAGLRVVRLI